MTNSTTIPDGYKRCSKCGQNKPVSKFGRNSKRRGGKPLSKCKTCHAEYMREYRESNPEYKERQRIRDAERWANDPEYRESLNEHRRKRMSDPEYRNNVNQKRREYYSTHPEYREKQKEHARKPEIRARAKKQFNQRMKIPEKRKRFKMRVSQYWRSEEYKERERIKRKEKRRSDSEYNAKIRAKSARYRASKRNAEGNHTEKDIELIYQSQGGRCWYCQCELNGDYHVDHRVPLSRGGSNDASNLVITCQPCNSSKSDKLPHEWNGRLL